MPGVGENTRATSTNSASPPPPSDSHNKMTIGGSVTTGRLYEGEADHKAAASGEHKKIEPAEKAGAFDPPLMMMPLWERCVLAGGVVFRSVLGWR